MTIYPYIIQLYTGRVDFHPLPRVSSLLHSSASILVVVHLDWQEVVHFWFICVLAPKSSNMLAGQVYNYIILMLESCS